MTTRLTLARFALAFSLSAVCWTIAPKAAHATSCVQPQLQSSKDNAVYAFIGRVQRELENTATLRVEVKVERVFKGVLPEKVEVSAGGMKGATLEKGQRYLIFARQSDPSAALFAHLCGGTMPASQAAKWLAQLGAGAPPTKGAQPVVPNPDEVEDDDESANGAASPSEPTAADTPISPHPAAPVPETHVTPEPARPTAATPAPADTRSGGCGACSIGRRAESKTDPVWLLLFAAALFGTRRFVRVRVRSRRHQ